MEVTADVGFVYETRW